MAGLLKSNYVKYNPSGCRSSLSSLIIDTFRCKDICFITMALCYYSFANQALYLAVGKHPLDLVPRPLPGRLVLDALLVRYLRIAVGE